MRHSRSWQNNALLTAAAALMILPNPCQLNQLVEQINSCKATFKDGILDLAPLDSLNRTGELRFKNFAVVKFGSIDFSVSYNPCSGFPCNSDSTAAACATDIYAAVLKYDLGSQTGNKIRLTEQQPQSVQIWYTSVDKGQGKDIVTVVTLVCSATEEASVANVSLSADNHLTFRLISRHCCLTPYQHTAGGWSPGDFIVFFFCLIVVLYFISFLLINGLCLKRTGLDLLPHREVWANLALLVKDGCVFTFVAVRTRLTQRGDYTRI